jgi:single-strand DNA-binding protein
MNISIISGRLTAEPELRKTSSGKSACKFTVAVNGSKKNDNGENETVFIKCSSWNKTAENICKYLKKGDMIYVNGSINSYSYNDKSGTAHYVTEISVYSAEFNLPKKTGTNNGTIYNPKKVDTSIGLSETEDIDGLIDSDALPF